MTYKSALDDSDAFQDHPQFEHVILPVTYNDI
jgi:hypothetical protein